MWKALFIVAALSISASPLDAAQPDNGRRIEKTQTQSTGDLRRDVFGVEHCRHPLGDLDH